MWNLEYDINGSTKQKQTQGQGEQTFGYQRGEGRVGWTGSLGLVDENYCISSGQAMMRSCFIAEGTISSHL